MKKVFLMVIQLAVLAGCAGTVAQFQNVNSTAIIDSSYDDVWTRVVSFFATNNISIRAIDKASGKIESDDMRVEYKDYNWRIDSLYCDCGRPPFLSGHKNPTGIFNISVRNVGKGTLVQINTEFRVESWSGNDFYGMNECASKGYLEEKLLNSLGPRVSTH